MKIKWLKKALTHLRRYFSPFVLVSSISPKEETSNTLISFHGDTYSIYNRDDEGNRMKEPEFKLVFCRYRLINYIRIVIHPDKIINNPFGK